MHPIYCSVHSDLYPSIYCPPIQPPHYYYGHHGVYFGPQPVCHQPEPLQSRASVGVRSLRIVPNCLLGKGFFHSGPFVLILPLGGSSLPTPTLLELVHYVVLTLPSILGSTSVPLLIIPCDGLGGIGWFLSEPVWLLPQFPNPVTKRAILTRDVTWADWHHKDPTDNTKLFSMYKHTAPGTDEVYITTSTGDANGTSVPELPDEGKNSTSVPKASSRIPNRLDLCTPSSVECYWKG